MSEQGSTATAVPHASRRNHWNGHLERHGLAVPERAALRFQGRTTTWRELRDRVRGLADAMARRGVGRGDRVALLMTNRPEFLETVLAANRLGAIAVPVNFRFTAPEVGYLLNDSGAGLLVADAGTEELASGAGQYLERGVPTVVVGALPGAAVEDYESVMSEGGEPHPPVDVPEDSPALIMYTSGTTGKPKGAVLSHQNLQAQAVTVIRAFQLSDDGEVNLVASPMFHIGAVGSIVGMILVGGHARHSAQRGV